MNPVALAHTVNSSGRLGMFVNPHACSCEGCHDFLTGIEEQNGFSNLSPPSALNLERQTAAPTTGEGASPTFSPFSNSSADTIPLNLPQRSNGGGIALGPTPTGLGNWRAVFHSSDCETDSTDSSDDQEKTELSQELRDEQENENFAFNEEDLRMEIVDHLTNYLTMLEKHQKVMTAKMDLYAFLLEDASVRLRLEGFNKKIKALKETLEKLE
jgi:hypothetical protein